MTEFSSCLSSLVFGRTRGGAVFFFRSPYIATGRLPHGQPRPPKRGPLPRDADARTRMARKLRSKQGSAIYAQRKAIVEPVNGQIKEARGLRLFLLRGLGKVDGEWHLIAATHNLLKLFRYRRSQQQMAMAAA